MTKEEFKLYCNRIIDRAGGIPLFKLQADGVAKWDPELAEMDRQCVEILERAIQHIQKRREK